MNKRLKCLVLLFASAAIPTLALAREPDEIRRSAMVFAETDEPMILAIETACPDLDATHDLGGFDVALHITFRVPDDWRHSHELVKAEQERHGRQCTATDKELFGRLVEHMRELTAEMDVYKYR